MTLVQLKILYRSEPRLNNVQCTFINNGRYPMITIVIVIYMNVYKWLAVV
jgi:hypothetical protein